MPRTDQSEMRLRGERGERDAVGEAMAQAMIASHPAVQRLRPEAHDWNDQLKARAGSAVKLATRSSGPAELLLLGKKNHGSLRRAASLFTTHANNRQLSPMKKHSHDGP